MSGSSIFFLAGFHLPTSSLAWVCLILCVFELWLGCSTLAGTSAIFFVFEPGLTLGRLTVFISNISTISFKISFYLFQFRNPSLSFGLFDASAISLNATLIWSLDDVSSIVYFVGKSSITLETCVVPVFATLIFQLRKWCFALLTIKPGKPCLSRVFRWSGCLWMITFVPRGTSRVL